MPAPPSITIVPASLPITAPITSAAPPTIIIATALWFDFLFWRTGGAPRRVSTACIATRALARGGPRVTEVVAFASDDTPATAVIESTRLTGVSPVANIADDVSRASG